MTLMTRGPRVMTGMPKNPLAAASLSQVNPRTDLARRMTKLTLWVPQWCSDDTKMMPGEEMRAVCNWLGPKG